MEDEWFEKMKEVCDVLNGRLKISKNEITCEDIAGRNLSLIFNLNSKKIEIFGAVVHEDADQSMKLSKKIQLLKPSDIKIEKSLRRVEIGDEARIMALPYSALVILEKASIVFEPAD